MRFYEWRHADAALRCVGLLSLALAAWIARHLFAVPDPMGKVSASAYLFALIGMTSACAGAALTALGRHLFDQVELPSRWTIHVQPQGQSAGLAGRDLQ